MTMRGYFRNPEATAETLVDGWLRTGDVCTQDEDGFYYFVDRAKDMIVSGGLNIYAKEVELALSAHPSIADVAVVGVPDDEFGEAVLAFVELEADGEAITADDVVEFAREQLASYKKPRHVRFVDGMPRTASGKVRKPVSREMYL